MVEQLKLLILNASRAERLTIRATLESLNVFAFIEVQDSQQALKLLKQQPVDIIITGLNVGKIDGWRFSRMIRSGLLKTPKNTPILLIPPIYCERIAETTARSYGIDAVLPFEQQDMLPQVLANVLSTHLEKSSRLNLLLLEPLQDKANDISAQLKLNFAITHTTTSKEALNAYYQQKFAIVLLDATAARAETSSVLVEEILQHNPKQAIVTIIDNDDANYAEQLLLSGVTDFIRAPYDPSFLNKVCDHAARREDFMVSYAEFANKVEQLSVSEVKYKELFSAHQRILLHLNTVVLELDQLGKIRFINPAWETLSGHGVKPTLQKPLTAFCINECQEKLQNTICDILGGGENQQQVEIKLQHKNGTQIWVECRFQLIKNSRNTATITATIDNIHERKQAELQLRHLAHHDPLTGLHNRYYFDQQLNRICQPKHTFDDIEHAIIYIDLDHFKIINDSKGHHQGDIVLKEVAQLFKDNIGDEHLVCRIGGDEFAVILTNMNLLEAHLVAEGVCIAIEQHTFKSEDQVYTISCSIGLAQITSKNCDPNECLKQADIALYIAKNLGRNLVHCYSKEDSQNKTLQTGLEWGHEIRQALQQDNIELHYQPIWDFKQSKVAYFEVLLRLKLNDKLVYPNQFIPSLEMLNDTFLMDQCVIRNTLACVEKHPELNQVAINLSAQSFLDERLLPLIESSLEKYQVSPTRIIFEITESASINNLKATRKMIEKLNSLGCHFSIDDFGTGFSTFNYLKQLPAQHVKIDGSFVRDMLNDPIDLALVKAINDISRSLDKRSVAEYVENKDIFFALKEIGVDYGQGYFIARPMAVEKVKTELENILKNKVFYQQ
ncbi:MULTISPECIES: EAL domain-containing protein [Pseudoalteromonas]|uniref:EAL domain-containing protein n=1 Tax=Pseudoalteromonas fuliginea TaxID=1872678 RepID=A0ABQ6RCD8_9GAMM|nr:MULTISPECIES: EAL domain-containing protein [Pseudoalteromonas]ALQ06929.1 diguanylate phosphodiesterase [Pseudoalteromonas sp. Bsw20308]KAA1150175.1 EAL domain-containing protein [Pseudoalteromonas fuliginea]KAA1164913.1 EAL domain-containing protein [Pseudoalteromonas fuliginea]KDC55489.1 diguanylate phosphodiesterase [Pseudoalteromonas sp. S3431]MDQ2045087.1 EAL domain-containing protein [Pseudoalteromonas sp. 20-92]